MADPQLIVEARRLRDDLRELKGTLRKTYKKANHQVISEEIRNNASQLAETWLAGLSQRPEMRLNISKEYLGNLNVHFQRILVAAEKATVRKKYDLEIKAVLEDYTSDLLVPLMQGNAQVAEPAVGGADVILDDVFVPSAFAGHSFNEADIPFVHVIIETLKAIGITVATGEKPKADRISEKVKKLIDGQHIFVGIFTRRAKLEGKNAWTTSEWVLDEKAYAYGKGRKLILLKEAEVESIGGIQGDYEYLEFTREKFHEVMVKLVQLFVVSVKGLQK